MRSARPRSANPAILSRCGVAQGRDSWAVQRRWKSDDGEKPPEVPFNLQLFESVTARVQKAKEEEIRNAQYHQRTARGRFFATLFCKYSTMAQLVECITDMFRSHLRHQQSGLLVRPGHSAQV